MGEPAWLLQSVVEAIHDAQIAEHGGASGLCHAGLPEAALAKPRNLFAYGTTDIFALAAACGAAIVQNHPFADGNKRTGFLAIYVFLALNGHELVAPEDEAAMTMFALAAGELETERLADWLRQNCQPV